MDISSHREYGSPERETRDSSDADSDLEELQGDIAKFDESVREFLASHHGASDAPRSARGGGRGRGARGPRKAAKPRGDITARLSKVNQAFLAGDYDQAVDLAFEVIRINAETHQAWTALSSIFRERGELDRALSAMVYAAHLRPKDVSGWMRCASFALDTIEEDEKTNLNTARLCYSAALRADPTHIDARLGKAAVCHRQGHHAAAVAEYKIVLRSRPYDLDLVRKLAESCVDSKNPSTALPAAIQAYRQFFDHEIRSPASPELESLWHDVGIYVELFAAGERYGEAVHELKALSRWLVGRGSEKYWDGYQEDDREWDTGADRRSQVPEYSAHPSDETLLKLGHETEALRHLGWFDTTDSHTADFVGDFPFLIYELGTELARYPATLLQLGRCYLTLGEQPAAEECFLAAIDADEDSIEARVELANMYERAREDEEALILAAEAMALREAREQSSSVPAGGAGVTRGNTPSKASRQQQATAPKTSGKGGGQGSGSGRRI
ncbi:hypothetical protein ACCO45_007226 [Purpureocillium lilacinum]|uniref:Uncharacterized protein n=1 Tax=Purpureocillium lilacinum TaxID=33203 RepID=A0ACC4DT46_PURLI